MNYIKQAGQGYIREGMDGGDDNCKPVNEMLADQ
jgi:hypothetical protein